MSSLYSKDYIKTRSLNEMQEILEGSKNIPDITDLKNRHMYVVLQHYLIKYLEENGKTDNVKKILDKYYNDFANYPHMFVYSPLLQEKFINKFMPKKTREKILNFRNKYYNSKECEAIYNKLRSNNKISDSEKNRLYAYLILSIKKDYKAIYNNKIYKLLAKNILNNNNMIKNMNEMELLYYCNYVAAVEAVESKTFPEIYLMSNLPSNGGYQSNGMIYLNKDTGFTPSLLEMTEVVCHETRHFYQQKNTIKEGSSAGFEIATFHLFNKYLSTEDYDSYHTNYTHAAIELDAEKYGFHYAGRVLFNLDRSDLWEKLHEIKEKRYSKRHYYGYMTDKNNNNLPIDSFIVDNMDKIVKKYPQELDSFPVLNSIYNKDGSRKNLKDMLVVDPTNLYEARKIYNNYINYEIANDGLKKINLADMNKDERTKFLISLTDFYRDKELLFNSYCRDKDYNKINKTQVVKTTKYQLYLMNQILYFVTNNIDSLMDCKKEEIITNKSFIFDFIIGLRDFNINNITNETIKNSEELKVPISKVQEKVNKVIYGFNKVYIEDRIKDFTEEQLDKEITTNSGKTMSIRNYLFKTILPKLDGHMEFELNGNKVYIGDLIRDLKKYITNKNKNR